MRTTTASISPYIVYRRARLPYAALADLQFGRTWARIDALRELRAAGERRSAELADALGALVPGADEAARSEIIKLRRDVHNQRADRAAARLEALGPHLDGGTRAAVRAWRELVLDVHRGETEALASLDEEKLAARRAFRVLFDHDAMAKSIQLSGAQLHQSLRRYVDDEGGPVKPSRARTFESSLVNFAYRAALKPSPFGRFTEVGAFPPDGDGPASTPDTDETRSEVTLNRVLLNWLVGALQRVPGGLELGVLLLNSSLETDAESVRFIGVRADGSATGWGGSEAVVRIRRDAMVERVLDVMAGGSAPVPAVLSALTDLTGEAATGRKVLAALLRIGLVSFRPGIDEQDPAYADKLAAFLAAGNGDGPAVLADRLDLLREVETGFPDAPVDKRQALLAAAEQAIADVAETGTVGPPPEAIVRAPVYEDAWTRARPATWSRDAVTAGLPALESLWRFASMLDYGQVKRLGLYSFAAERFGDRETVPFLDFFDRLTRLPAAEQDAVLAGQGSAPAARLAQQRAAALRDLGERIVEEDGVLRLDPAAVTAACAGVEDTVDPDSVTFRLQFAGGSPDPAVVVNGVLTGYGVYFSRFSSFVEGDEDWNLRTALREHLRTAFPGQTDLNAVLGFNFNLHPELTDRVLDYPGSWPGAGERRAYGLGGLHLRIDHARRSLTLWDPEAGEDVDLVPLNFLIPVGVPMLYQVLEALSPTTRYPWQPLSHIRDALDPSAYPGSSPRLVVGDVVVDRRSWTVPAADIPMLDEVSRDSFPALVAFDAWRREQGLPQHAFVVCQTLGEYNALSGRAKGLPRDWSDFEHLHKASVHKPMYVDFRNPYLVRSFAKSALSRKDVFVSVRECLPGTDEYGPDGPAAAEEFFVELYRERT